MYDMTGKPEKKKLTDWKAEPTVRMLKQDYSDAKPMHDTQVSKISTWLDNLNVTGAAKINTPKGNSRIVPKLIRKQAEWRYSDLSEPFLSTSDIFNVAPVTWEDKAAAEQNQMVLNNQFNTRIDKVKFVDDLIRTAVDEGTVFIRVGWDFQEEETKVIEPVMALQVNPAIAPVLDQLTQMRQEDPEQFESAVSPEMKQSLLASEQNGQPIEASIVGYKKVTVMKTIKNQPTLDVCDYRNVMVDPTCMGDLDKAGFLVYSFESSLAELEKDGRYSNLDCINISNSSILGEPDHSSSLGVQTFNYSDKPRKKFVVFEYWGYRDVDDTGTLKPIVAAWVGDTLIRMEENPFPDKKIPFVAISYLPVRRSIYGEPDGALLEDNQKIIGAVTRAMIDIMGKSANGQTGVRKDALDITNKRKFEKGLDYEFNAQVDPRQAIYMHTFPEIPASAQFMLQLQNMEAESLTGVKSFSQGVSGQSLGDVAVGVRGALDAASKRKLNILRRLSAGVVKIGKKILSMNAEFLSETEVVRITNDSFVQVRRDDLAGDFDLSLSISTAEEDDNKAQELSFMLQTMGNSLDPAMSQIILSDIAKLRKMPELAKRISEYQPQPDPVAQQKAELEVQLLQVDIAAKQASVELDKAKAVNELAKAKETNSNTDLKDLDFLEQESGVKQERALQHVSQQAKSQAGLKVVEHGLQQETAKQQALAQFLKSSSEEATL